MFNQVSCNFVATRYHWTLSAHTRISGEDYCVYFDTKQDYEKTLDDPFELARIARDKGCNTVSMYVSNELIGDKFPCITLSVDSVLGLGQKLGFVGNPSGNGADWQAV